MHTLTLSKIGALEEEFLGRVRKGDLEAIAMVYDAHHEALCSFAKRLLGDDHAAEDLVQDVFVALPSVAHRLVEAKSILVPIAGSSFAYGRERARALLTAME